MGVAQPEAEPPGTAPGVRWGECSWGSLGGSQPTISTELTGAACLSVRSAAARGSASGIISGYEHFTANESF